MFVYIIETLIKCWHKKWLYWKCGGLHRLVEWGNEILQMGGIGWLLAYPNPILAVFIWISFSNRLKHFKYSHGICVLHLTHIKNGMFFYDGGIKYKSNGTIHSTLCTYNCCRLSFIPWLFYYENVHGLLCLFSNPLFVHAFLRVYMWVCVCACVCLCVCVLPSYRLFACEYI